LTSVKRQFDSDGGMIGASGVGADSVEDRWVGKMLDFGAVA